MAGGLQPVLVLTGDRRDEDGLEAGAELYRGDFAGWGAPNVITAGAGAVARDQVGGLQAAQLGAHVDARQPISSAIRQTST